MAVVAHLADGPVADADLVLAGAVLVVAALELAVGGGRVQQRIFFGEELGALLHRVALHADVDHLVLAVEQEELELRRAGGPKAHRLHAPGHAVQHVAGIALDRLPVGPDERAHHESGVGLVAQDAQAREVRLRDEVGVADGLAVVGARHHVAGDVEGQHRGAEGDAVVQRMREVGDVHGLAAGDAAVVAVLDADALHAVGPQPVDDLVARARKAHRAACRLAHSSQLPLAASRGDTIAPSRVRSKRRGCGLAHALAGADPAVRPKR